MRTLDYGCGTGMISRVSISNSSPNPFFVVLGEEDIDKIFEGAGVGKDFGFEVIAKEAAFETEKHSMTADVFMARGTKA